MFLAHGRPRQNVLYADWDQCDDPIPDVKIGGILVGYLTWLWCRRIGRDRRWYEEAGEVLRKGAAAVAAGAADRHSLLDRQRRIRRSIVRHMRSARCAGMCLRFPALPAVSLEAVDMGE